MLAVLALLALAGCTTEADLAYAPPLPSPGLFAPAPVIATISVVDRRKEAPHRLATLMSTIGMPVKILDTRLPVSDEVGMVFDRALLARRLTLNDGNGPLAASLLVSKFDSDMIWGGQANIDLSIALVDRRSNQVVYADRVVRQVHDNGHIAANILIGQNYTSIDVLQRMCERVLGLAVDEMLEKPGFKQVVMQNSGSGGSLPPR